MATRLFLHDAATQVTGTLPTTEQNVNSVIDNIVSQSTNKSMNITKGTLQVQKSKAIVNNDGFVFGTRFISDPLDMSSLSANTWIINYGIGGQITSGAQHYWPSDSASNARCALTVYVWRPSTGVKVGDVFNGYLTIVRNTSSVTEETFHYTFSGSAVSSMQTDDVLIVEIFTGSFRLSSSITLSIFYDGTVETTTNDTNVTNHAAFLETPQDLTFKINEIEAVSDHKDILVSRSVVKV